MSKHESVIRLAITGVLALSGAAFATSAMAADNDKEQCAGIIKAGKNDCATATNACHGHVAVDASPDADTETSLRFYRDTLGMRVAGTSENYGTEQEHLNNVFGAHLVITALRAPQGPGIELLEYLAPRGGRPIPADTQANDDWYWQINLRAASPPAVTGVTQTSDASLGFHAGAILKDPDGHASLIAAE